MVENAKNDVIPASQIVNRRRARWRPFSAFAAPAEDVIRQCARGMLIAAVSFACQNGAISEPPTGDECTGIDCSAHGSCINGTCSCDTGYAGADCSTCAAGYIEQDATCVPVCIDNDGDGYGVSCSLGIDCDDTNAAIWQDCTIDEPGVFVLGAIAYSVDEDAGSIEIAVHRVQGDLGAVGVSFATLQLGDGQSPNATDQDVDGSGDYDGNYAQLSFADGVTSQTFSVPINDDTEAEGAETFEIYLLEPTGGAQLGDTAVIRATVTILDDEPPPCDGVTCSGHGACVTSGDPLTASCDCDAGYVASGLNCEVEPSDPCLDVDCSGFGTCVDSGASAVCDCDAGYHAVGLTCVPNEFWQLGTGHYESAKLPLEIVNPREGLAEGEAAPSYYYRCYPDTRWRVPISVLGGAWPFRYELVTAPDEVTLGEFHGQTDYGILEWNNPIVGSHAISVLVTDQEGNTDTASWTLTVTTQNALFVDAINGRDSNDGAIDSPFQTFAGWYTTGAGSRGDQTYRYHHVYYRAGSYATDDSVDTDYAGTGVVVATRKPHTHIAYDGELVVFDVSNSSLQFTGGDDTFFGSIEWRGVCSGTISSRQKAASFGTADRIVVFENTFGNQGGVAATGANPAWFFFSRLEPIAKRFISFHNNTINDLHNFMLIESYTISKVVVEGNTLNNTVGNNQSRLFYLKVDTNEVSIRNNTSDTTNADAALVHIGSARGLYGDIDIGWNNWRVSSSDTWIVRVGIELSVPLGRIHIYRNTLTGGTILHTGTAGGGPVWYQNNVRQYGGGINGITEGTWSGDIPQFTLEGTETDLVGTDGLVDNATNQLVGSHRTTHLGFKGHEVGEHL